MNRKKLKLLLLYTFYQSIQFMNENYYNHIIFNPFAKSINPIIMIDFLLILFSLYLLKIDYSLFF